VNDGQAAAADAARDRMGELGLVQRSLAQQAGVDTKTVNNLLTKKHFPNARNRARIESILWPAEPPGVLMRIASGGPIPTEAPPRPADSVESQIESIPHLLPEDRELFLRIYRTRRDEHTARRIHDLELLLEKANESVRDPEARETVVSQFREQIARLKRAGYETLRNETEL
jgi:transcriptional regulator with XRE-family HTH domain